jgi:hypothetical protein
VGVREFDFGIFYDFPFDKPPVEPPEQFLFFVILFCYFLSVFSNLFYNFIFIFDFNRQRFPVIFVHNICVRETLSIRPVNLFAKKYGTDDVGEYAKDKTKNGRTSFSILSCVIIRRIISESSVYPNKKNEMARTAIK